MPSKYRSAPALVQGWILSNGCPHQTTARAAGGRGRRRLRARVRPRRRLWPWARSPQASLERGARSRLDCRRCRIRMITASVQTQSDFALQASVPMGERATRSQRRSRRRRPGAWRPGGRRSGRQNSRISIPSTSRLRNPVGTDDIQPKVAMSPSTPTRTGSGTVQERPTETGWDTRGGTQPAKG